MNQESGVRNQEFLYQQLVSRMQEIAVVPPQTIGPFTPLYKRFIPLVKWSPWKSIGTLSFFAAAALYLLFGANVIKLASLLQLGF